jgi:hypothetical protein
VRGDQVLLTLDGDVTTLILPVSLAEQVVHALIAQARPAPVLTHPDAPDPDRGRTVRDTSPSTNRIAKAS